MKNLLAVFFLASAFFSLTAQNENQPSMQDWVYPYEVHHITIADSLEIAYVDEGKGKCTLLFLHGLGSNLKAWWKNIDYLKKKYRCMALDLPGYGKSGKGDYPFDMTFFSQAVRAFMDEMGLEKVVLVGHSMGGQIAVHTVLNSQEGIEKLILLAPAGFELFTEQETAWFQNVYTPAVVQATPEEQIVKNFHLNFHAFPSDAQFMIDDRLHLRQTGAYSHFCHMIPQCVMGMLNEPVFDRLSEITVPTLVVFGENDSLIPNKLLHPALTTLEVAKGGQLRIPGSELKMISSAGHFAQWEQAAKVNEAMLGFLGTVKK